MLLLRGRARRVRGLTGAHRGHLQQVQQHRRPIDDLHYYTTFIKFGLGRASYDASQEIRNRHLTREEGVALVKRFDGELPERFAKQIFEYLSVSAKEFPVAHKMFASPTMTEETFRTLADQFRSPHLWRFDDGRWHLRRAVWHEKV